jgi:hypothetical protein
VNVGHAAGIVEQLGEERTRAEQPHQATGHHDPEDPADERRGQPFQQELQENLAALCPERFATPISRVRSCTFTNMMFMMPTPPIASVSTPMKVRTIFNPMTMPR